MRQILLLFIFIILSTEFSHAQQVKSKEKNELNLKQYILLITKNDPYFQSLLIEKLKTKYTKASLLPASDLVMDITTQYNLKLPERDNNGLEGTVSLSKLFPATATTLTAEYTADRSFYTGTNTPTSGINLELSQAIARNAFGQTTRLLEKSIDLDNKLVRYQVVEAYEDYLAAQILQYINWYTTYQQVLLAKKTIKYNQELLSLIRRKRRFNIAYAYEVDKVRLELLNAREQLILHSLQYDILTNKIYIAIDNKQNKPRTPVLPEIITEKNYTAIASAVRQNSYLKNRTFTVLSLMEKKGILAKDIAQNNLLPSASLFAGYSQTGTDYTINDPRHFLYFGITSTLNFGRQQEKAVYETHKLDLRQILLQNNSNIQTLKTDITNLHMQLLRQNNLTALAENKVVLTRRILNAERRNFIIGKAKLNDLLLVKNQAEQANYDALYHKLVLQQLLLEWKRITDSLVTAKDIFKDKPSQN